MNKFAKQLLPFSSLLFIISLWTFLEPDTFLTFQNFKNVLSSTAANGIIAAGMTFVIITAGIDLSVGSMLTFLCCVCAKIMMGTDNGLLGIFGTIGIGAVCGLVNGVLVSYVKLNSFITTLGTSSIFTALALRLSSGTVLVIPDNCDPLFQAVGISSFGPIHILIVWFVIIAIVLGLLLSRTVFGQQLYTIGSNPVAARFSGIRAKKNTTVAYILTGICVGFAAVLMMANVKSSNPQAASGKEMEIILMVVLGGVSVTGGKGSVWGTIIGVLFYGVMSSGLTHMNLSQYLQWTIMGTIMIIALSMDVLKERGVTLWKKQK